ncbi:MAG: hypothetical protein ACI9OH_000750 [Oleispira sp.]|jgi:hypothetical protein
MKKLFMMLTASIAISVLAGCVSLDSISLTQLPEKRDHVVTASASDVLFLGFTTQNDFVDEAVINLKSKCPRGKLSGILTKHQTTSYILVFKREVIATGYCNTVEG